MDLAVIEACQCVEQKLVKACEHSSSVPNAVQQLRQLEAIRACDAALDRAMSFGVAPLSEHDSTSLSRCCDAAMSFYLRHYVHDSMHIRNAVLTLRLRDLVLLVVAKLYSLWLQTLPAKKRASFCSKRASDFPSVLDAEAVYDRHTPVLNMSQHALMWSLFAVFIRTPEFHYSLELYQYTLLLMWRALQLLCSIGDKQLFNVRALRDTCVVAEPLRGGGGGGGDDDDEHKLYRFSPRFVTDVGILVRALQRKFSVVFEFRQRVDQPLAPSQSDRDAVVRWLRNRARTMPSLYVQQNYSKCHMRAGEVDFYLEEECNAFIEQVVLQRYRPQQFCVLMEDCSRRPQQIIEQELTNLLEGKLEREPPGLLLVALDTFMERLRSWVPNLNASLYVMLEWQMLANNASPGIDTVKQNCEPMLVYCFNGMQVWDGATRRMYMHNSAIAALAAWARLVLAPPYNGLLRQCDAAPMCRELLGMPTTVVEERNNNNNNNATLFF